MIVDVEATTAIRQAEVGAAKTMLDRTVAPGRRWGLRLGRDGRVAVDERGIEPHVKLIDKAERTDGTFSRSDFAFDLERNLMAAPAPKS